MKSQPTDNTVRTSCKDCAFAVYSDKTQTACYFDRISKFEDSVTEAYDHDNEFYVIDRLCTYYRNKSWGYSVKDQDKVKKESAIGFDLIFDCNNINANQVQIITNFIKTNNYYPEKITTILLHDNEHYSSAKNYVTAIARAISSNVNISICDNMENFMHQHVLKSKNGYHALIKYPELIETNILHRLNNFVNVDLQKLVLANVNDILFIGNIVYKILYHTNMNIDYMSNVDTILKDAKEKNMFIEI